MGLHGKQGLGDHPSLMSLWKEHSSVDLGQHVLRLSQGMQDPAPEDFLEAVFHTQAFG